MLDSDELNCAVERLRQDFRRLQCDHDCLLEWRLSLDNARRRAGACHPVQKRISLSRHHLRLNDYLVVKDTLLHEVAHAIVWEKYRQTGHGSRWKQTIQQLGGIAKATGQFETPTAPWVLVYLDANSGKIRKLAERHRRSRKIAAYSLKGEPDTQGRLYYLSQSDYQRWLESPEEISKLNFYQ